MPCSKEECISSGLAVWRYIQDTGVVPDHGTYMSLARLEAIRGDPEAALQWVSEEKDNDNDYKGHWWCSEWVRKRVLAAMAVAVAVAVCLQPWP